MSILYEYDLRETEVLFKPRLFSNCVAMFTQCEYVKLMEESLEAGMNKVARDIHELSQRIKYINECIGYGRVISTKELEEIPLWGDIEGLNINRPYIKTPLVDLADDATVAHLISLNEVNKYNLRSLLDKIYCMGQMLKGIREELKKSDFDDEEEELEEVANIMYGDFEYDTMSKNLNKATEVEVGEEFYDKLLSRVLAINLEGRGIYLSHILEEDDEE